MRIISGKAKGKKILTPNNKKTRPLKDMVRESIFNIIHHSNLLSLEFDQCFVLDLFSGVGSFGLEAISRGAKKVVFFEEYKPTFDLLNKNIDTLSFNKEAETYKKDIYNENHFKKLNYKFDLVFIDPPFKDVNIEIILEKLVNSKILNKKSLIIIHRHKKTIDNFTEKFKIFRKEVYGSSKIIFGFFIF
tara:strand:- start:3627 stop:4193 length:567 start_codon:yes stop_codon:yes gene_type:complete